MSVLNNGFSPLSSFSNSGNNYTQKQNSGSFHINPLVFSSLKNLDVDRLEEDLAKEIQRKKVIEEKEKVSNTY